MNDVSKAVVTGGAGFIGSHIVDELLSLKIETFVIDDFSTGSENNLQQHRGNSLLHVIEGDAKDIEMHLENENNIDVLFHEAAIVSVPRSITEPQIVHDVNVNMTLSVMDFCVSKKIKFIFASSAAVYGKINNKAHEQMVCNPISPYGASKLCIENYLSSYFYSFGLEYVALRYFNVYGSRQRLNDYSGVITIFTNKLLSNQIPMIDGDGKQVRDFISVNDIVKANLLAMYSKKMNNNVYNVATGFETSISKLFAILRDITDRKEIEPNFGPPRTGDVKRGLSDISKIQSVGFVSDTDMKSGLVDVVSYLSDMQKLEQLA